MFIGCGRNLGVFPQEDVYVVDSKQKWGGELCKYKLTDNRKVFFLDPTTFVDSCGCFDIGDTVYLFIRGN